MLTQSVGVTGDVRLSHAELSTKSHVFEVAANPWLFPRIVALAVNSTLRSEFAALLRVMTRPDPRDRPTFAGVLRILDSLVTA